MEPVASMDISQADCQEPQSRSGEWSGPQFQAVRWEHLRIEEWQLPISDSNCPPTPAGSGVQYPVALYIILLSTHPSQGPPGFCTRHKCPSLGSPEPSGSTPEALCSPRSVRIRPFEAGLLVDQPVCCVKCPPGVRVRSFDRLVLVIS